MSDAAQNLDQEDKQDVSTTETTETVSDKPSYEELEQRLNSVLSKHNELMDEAKNAKREKRRIKEEQIEKEKKLAEKNGEFEKLWKTASQEKEQLTQQLKDIQNANRQERITTTAMRISTELADGHNAELLSEFVKRNLENLAEDDGTVGDNVIEGVVSEFKTNEKYKSLLRRSKASGGGAPGNLKGSSDKASLTRAEFEKLDPSKRVDFINKVRSGSAELIDN